MSTERDMVHALAEFAAGVEYRRLPDDAVEGAKKSILDTLGVILAASGLEPAMTPIIDLVRETGGRAESSVFGFGDRVPAIMAAFANGAMAHCLDFDDQTPWGQHAASSIIPAVFAVAERRGGVSGKDLIAAVAVGARSLRAAPAEYRLAQRLELLDDDGRVRRDGRSLSRHRSSR